jgi:hypothetical protein
MLHTAYYEKTYANYADYDHTYANYADYKKGL